MATFWLEEMGVDGFRLDAIPYLVEEGDRLAGTPGTHAVLREYAAHIRRLAPNAYTVGEVWDSIGSMLPYYPDQLDSHFAFAASDALLEAVRTGSAKKLYEPYLRLQRAVPAAERWSPFLRNHDQTRTLTELKGDVARNKVGVTLCSPPDSRSCTTARDRNPATSRTLGCVPDALRRVRPPGSRAERRGTPSRLHDGNVEAQQADPTSLLNLHRRLIHSRAANDALGSGELVPLTASNDAVAAYVRRTGDRAVLVVANLGATPLAGVTVASPDRAIPAGRYALTSLLGGPAGQPLRVGTNGRIQGFVPMRSPAPRGPVLELVEALRSTMSMLQDCIPTTSRIVRVRPSQFSRSPRQDEWIEARPSRGFDRRPITWRYRDSSTAD